MKEESDKESCELGSSSDTKGDADDDRMGSHACFKDIRRNPFLGIAW